MNKMITTVGAVLAGVGAVNWGLVKFVNIDVLSFVPAGIMTQVVVAAIAAGGVLVLYAVYEKKI